MDCDCKTRVEIKGRNTQYKEVYNQKTVRQWETMRENRENKRKAAVERSNNKVFNAESEKNVTKNVAIKGKKKI